MRTTPVRDHKNYAVPLTFAILISVLAFWLDLPSYMIWLGGFATGGSIVAINRKHKINEGKDIG